MKKLCSKKESLKIEENAYLQKCWIDGSFKSEKDVGIVKDVIFIIILMMEKYGHLLLMV